MLGSEALDCLFRLMTAMHVLIDGGEVGSVRSARLLWTEIFFFVPSTAAVDFWNVLHFRECERRDIPKRCGNRYSIANLPQICLLHSDTEFCSLKRRSGAGISIASPLSTSCSLSTLAVRRRVDSARKARTRAWAGHVDGCRYHGASCCGQLCEHPYTTRCMMPLRPLPSLLYDRTTPKRLS